MDAAVWGKAGAGLGLGRVLGEKECVLKKQKNGKKENKSLAENQSIIPGEVVVCICASGRVCACVCCACVGLHPAVYACVFIYVCFLGAAKTYLSYVHVQDTLVNHSPHTLGTSTNTRTQTHMHVRTRTHARAHTGAPLVSPTCTP
jgi:hypothetical protein